MPTLAPKLPWTHPFAGGYPRLGGQPLPTDPDAIDYLNRVAAADGAAVEVGVAVAVDDFFKGMKADGIFSAIKAACVLCGARTLSGALVPLVGTAPTNVANNFASGDYDRSSGLKGDGSTKYLNTNRAGDADGEDDYHQSIYATAGPTSFANFPAYIGNNSAHFAVLSTGTNFYVRSRFTPSYDSPAYAATGLLAVSRSSETEYSFRSAGSSQTYSRTSDVVNTQNHFVFAHANASTPPTASSPTTARLAFYSIGSALDLAALDNRVSTLVAAIAAAL